MLATYYMLNKYHLIIIVSNKPAGVPRTQNLSEGRVHVPLRGMYQLLCKEQGIFLLRKREL